MTACRLVALLFLLVPARLLAQTLTGDDLPPRRTGNGPYDQLVIQNAYMIDGLGGPTQGPVTITVEDDRIVAIKPASRAAAPDAGARIIDAKGMYALPGFIDTHGHLHSVKAGKNGSGPAVPSDYVAKLWLAHGVTTVREVGNGRSIDWVMEATGRARRNEIAAPRIYPFIFFPRPGSPGEITTPDAARAFVRLVARKGAAGIKFLGAARPVLEAALEEAEKRGLKTTMHHAQISVVQSNVLTTSELGLDSMEHWYGLPEALFDDRIIQDYPPDYVYQNEQDRFGEAGKLWRQAAKPGSARYEEVITTLLERDFGISPTFTIYIANRDWMRARNADWHRDYTLPGLWDFFRPSLQAHGSYWFDWTQDRELAWAENFRIWMHFINDYKNRGGLVTTGSDSGYIYQTYGFGYVQELELLHEAGFHPLEVIQSATFNGAKMIGIENETGTLEAGKKADIILLPENPLQNFKTLYGSGHLTLDIQTGKVSRVGGVKYTIRDGIVYDAEQLRTQIRERVAKAKVDRGLSDGAMPVEN